MEKAAILHYMDQNYSFMNGNGEYVFRIRVKKDDAKKVILHGRDKYIHMLKSSDKRCMEMAKVACDGLGDYYEVALTLDMVCFRYFFEFFFSFFFIIWISIWMIFLCKFSICFF